MEATLVPELYRYLEARESISIPTANPKTSEPRRGRNRLINAALAFLIVASNIGCLPIPGFSPASKSTVQAGIPEKKRDIIFQTAEKLGIKYDKDESELWTKQGFDPLPIPTNITKEDRSESIRRIRQTLNLMSQSKNPYFKNAADFFNPILEKDASFEILDNIPSGSVMLMYPLIEEEGFLFIIRTSVMYVNTRSADTLANDLSHEMEHIRRFMTIHIPNFSFLSPEQKYQASSAIMTNPQKVKYEEAAVHGYHALGYLVNVGLTQRRWEGSAGDIVASLLIASGGDINSEEWANKVEKELVSLRGRTGQ